MPVVETYLNTFDTSINATTVGATGGSAGSTLTDFSYNVYRQISLSDAQVAFKIVTNNDFSNVDSSGNYTNNNLLSNFQLVGRNTILEYTSELVKGIFGFNGGTGLLDNEDAVRSDFVSKFAIGVDQIENAGVVAGGSSDTVRDNGKAACLTLFNNLKFSAINRFELGYNAHDVTHVVTDAYDLSNTTNTGTLVFSSTGKTGLRIYSYDSASRSVTFSAVTTPSTAYAIGDLLYFIHPLNGEILHYTVVGTDLTGSLNSGTTQTATVIFTKTAMPTGSAVYTKFFKKVSGAYVEVASSPLVITKGANGETDLSITTLNTPNIEDFVKSDDIVLVNINASTVTGLRISSINSLQTAYLNNYMRPSGESGSGVAIELPLEAGDIIYFKLTINTPSTQTDKTGATMAAISCKYRLAATLAVTPVNEPASGTAMYDGRTSTPA